MMNEIENWGDLEDGKAYWFVAPKWMGLMPVVAVVKGREIYVGGEKFDDMSVRLMPGVRVFGPLPGPYEVNKDKQELEEVLMILLGVLVQCCGSMSDPESPWELDSKALTPYATAINKLIQHGMAVPTGGTGRWIFAETGIDPAIGRMAW